MSPAASHPSILTHRGRDTLLFLSCVIPPHHRYQIGTATTPLITAVQNNMAMGSIFVAASAPPASVAAATIA